MQSPFSTFYTQSFRDGTKTLHFHYYPPKTAGFPFTFDHIMVSE